MSDKIVDYAIRIVIDGASSAADDDLDEDGILLDEDEWLEALALANKIIVWIEDNAEEIVTRAGQSG